MFFSDLRVDDSARSEEIAQRNSFAISPGKPVIELTDAQLEWTDQPTVVLIEQFERRTAIEIERADGATLLDLASFVLEDDSKRQPFRSADVWPVSIDPTGTSLIEKRACTDSMRLPVSQQIRMRTTNPLGLDSGHTEVVHTTGRTALPTLQAFRVDLRERVRLVVDLSV